MSLLLFANALTCPSSSLSPSSSSSSSSSTFALIATPVSRLHLKPIFPHTKSLSINGNKLGVVVTKAFSAAASSSDIKGPAPPPEAEQEVVPVEKLPLESKLQERMEQKLKMKLAKKIRLRRKRLLRKRKMRKKGRWPPSKMNKLKNV